MAKREISIPMDNSIDTGVPLSSCEYRAVARWDQESGVLSGVDDADECLLYRGNAQPERVKPSVVAFLLCAVRVGNGNMFSVAHRRYLDGLVDEVLREEREDRARYGRTG